MKDIFIVRFLFPDYELLIIVQITYTIYCFEGLINLHLF